MENESDENEDYLEFYNVKDKKYIHTYNINKLFFLSYNINNEDYEINEKILKK